MSSAADAHLGGDREKGAALFARADSLRVRHWLNPAWSLEVEDGAHVREARPQGDTARFPKEQHDKRNVPAAVRRAVLERDGFRCHFCGVPVVDAEIRKIAHGLYPKTVPWDCYELRSRHAGFAVIWLQYDHVVPRSHGGKTAEDNLVITGALCNYAKWDDMKIQLHLEDPRNRVPRKMDGYDGLERLMTG